MAEDRLMKVKIEDLTEEAFAPYGEVLGYVKRSPDWSTGAGVPIWFSSFSLEGTAAVGFNTYVYEKPPTEYEIYQLEQHPNIKQTMIPMEGKPSILYVAPPSPWKTSPDLDKFKAFLLDGTRGVVLEKLTWHAHDAPVVLPLYPPTLNCIWVHEKETWDDVISGAFEFTHRVNLREEMGVVIQMTW